MIIRSIELAHNIKAILSISIEKGTIEVQWEPDMSIIASTLAEDEFEELVVTYRVWRNQVLSKAAQEKGMELITMSGAPDVFGFRDKI